MDNYNGNAEWVLRLDAAEARDDDYVESINNFIAEGGL